MIYDDFVGRVQQTVTSLWYENTVCDYFPDIFLFAYLGITMRTEKIALTIGLDKKQYDLVKDRVDSLIDLNSSNLCLQNDFNVKIEYKFNIEYYGKIEENLNNILSIINTTGVVADINLEELNYNECIIKNLLDRIKELKDLYLSSKSNNVFTDLKYSFDRHESQVKNYIDNRDNE